MTKGSLSLFNFINIFMGALSSLILVIPFIHKKKNININVLSRTSSQGCNSQPQLHNLVPIPIPEYYEPFVYKENPDDGIPNFEFISMEEVYGV